MRLQISISEAPFSDSPANKARDDPPAPSNPIFLLDGLKFKIFKDLTNPRTSVFVPINRPLKFLTVLTAPTFFAIGVISSKYSITEVLWGIVTLNPEKFRDLIPSNAWEIFSGSVEHFG